MRKVYVNHVDQGEFFYRRVPFEEVEESLGGRLGLRSEFNGGQTEGLEFGPGAFEKTGCIEGLVPFALNNEGLEVGAAPCEHVAQSAIDESVFWSRGV